MKQTTFLFTLSLILTILFSCNRNDNRINNLSDTEFVHFISKNSNASKRIKRIDSILKIDNSLSPHKTGLLYYYKAEFLVNLNKYEHAIINFKKALNFFEKEGNQKLIAITHNGLGRVNTTINKFDVALEQLNFALNIFIKTNDKDNELVALDGLAYLQFSQKHYSKAAENINKLLTINLELNDSSTIAKNYGNLGYISELLEQKKQAENYYIKAVNINRKIHSENTMQLRNLGAFYLTINQPKKCELLYLEALKIENKKENTLVLKDIYAILIDSINDKNISNFLEFTIKQDSINTLLNKLESEEKIKLIEDQYKLIAKEKELLQEQKDQFNNTVLFLIITGLLLMIGLFLYQKNRNSKLNLKQDKLILEQKVLRTQMNPHFIFNALTSIQKTIFDENPLKSATYLSKFAKLIRQNFEFVSKDEILLSDDIDALKNYIDTQQLRFDNKFDYKIKIDDDINPLQVNIPPMLLQPFVENAIEHGLKPKTSKGLLEIEILKKGSLYHFKILDNGIGYNIAKEKEKREHSLDVFLKRLKLRNLGEEKLFSINSLKENKGTIVNFSLKLNEW